MRRPPYYPRQPLHFSLNLPPMKRPWIVIACAAIIVTLAMGVRQGFGLFLPQMSAALDISRASFGLALATYGYIVGVALSRSPTLGLLP